MTSRAGHLASTARAATLGRAGRATCHLPRQAGVFCRSRPGLVALVRTVGRPRRSAVKVGRKLEKRAAQASTTDTPEQLRASPTGVGSTTTAARSQLAKPGTDASLLFFGSPAISPGLSRPLGLGWLVARPVRLTPESPGTAGPSQQASQPAPVLAPRSPRRCPAPATSSPPIPAPALPVLSSRRLAHVPRSSRCR